MTKVKRYLSPFAIGITAIVFVVALLFATGVNSAIQATNKEEFCISCHEMRDNSFKEYEGTEHDVNVSGVRATCADCHVPKEFFPKIARKIFAVKDVYHWMLGTVDTPEKFEERRLHMAETVWKMMKETDSRECRSCHEFSAMALDVQDKSARRKHQRAIKNGETCIDCHKGVAHSLPRENI